MLRTPTTMVMIVLLIVFPAFAGTVYLEDFEASDGGYVHSGTLDEWQYGSPDFVDGPSAANSGTSCWGTDLIGTYENGCNQILSSVLTDLTSYLGPFMVSCALWNTSESELDVLTWEYTVDNGLTWNEIDHWSGTSLTPWSTQTFLVPGDPDSIQLRWVFTSNESNQFAGTYVDDVRIEDFNGTTPTPVPLLTNIVIPAGHGTQESPLFEPGDSFSVDVTIDNANSTHYTNIPLVVLLDAYGYYFFAPVFSTDFDFILLDEIVPGINEISILPAFDWPDCTGVGSGLIFYAALTNTSISELFGNLDTQVFGYDAYCTPAPTPTPSGDGYISGRAVFHVTGINDTPLWASKAVCFSLDGANCQSVWMRQRAVEWIPDESFYQIKMVGNENWPGSCTAEWDFWDMEHAADGDYIVTWGLDNGTTWLTCDAPNGTSETIHAKFVFTCTHAVAGTGPCAESPAPGTSTTTLISFEGYETGFSTICPDAR